VFELEDKNKASALSKAMDKFYSEFQQGKNPSLWGVIFRKMGLTLAGNTFVQLLDVIVTTWAIPVLLRDIVLFLKNEKVTYIGNGYVLTFLLFAMQLLNAMFQALSQNTQRRMHLMVSSMLTNAIYQKNFQISLEARKEFSDGNVMNLINVDVPVLQDFHIPLHLAWALPVQLAIAITLLFGEFGVSIFFGLAYVILGISVSLGSGKFLIDFFKEMVVANDRRITRVREMIMGIKVVKYRAMEDFFRSSINMAREAELWAFKKWMGLVIATQSFGAIAPVALPLITFVSYAATGKFLSVEKVVPALYLFQRLDMPLIQMSYLVSQISTLLVSAKRVQSFLTATEEDEKSLIANMPLEYSENAIVLENAEFGFTMDDSGEEAKFSLKGLNLTVPRGKLVAVVGDVGSGKSSLLNALARKLKLRTGKASTFGKVALCEQTPWLLTSSIEENIIFFNERNEERLSAAIDMACLGEDLKTLDDGIHTKLGESGTNLSGGQKARIALARALYSNSDIYLLDDPVAALDSKVGKRVFDKAIVEGLKDKTVLMTTHQLHLLAKVDTIIVIQNGQIVQTGQFDELKKSGGIFSELVKEEEEEEVEVLEGAAETGTAQSSPAKEIIAAEDRAEGAVKKKIYASYLNALGYWYPTFIVLFILGNIIAQIASLFYLTDSGVGDSTPSGFILIYASLGASIAVSNIVVTALRFLGSLFAARKIHNGAIAGLLEAPISFYDSQPVGRIINRMSADVRSVDNDIRGISAQLVPAFTLLVVNLVIIVRASVYISILVILILALSYFIFAFYQKSNREMKRVVSIVKSPRDAHVSESITGALTIKIAGVQKQFIQKNWNLIDDYESASYLLFSMRLWVNLRLGIITSLLIFGLGMLGTVLVYSGNESPIFASTIGLSLVGALGFSRAVFEFLLFMGLGEAEVRLVLTTVEFS
jgi:ABC-type multidrug transport system fused ATPase/permease subunit